MSIWDHINVTVILLTCKVSLRLKCMYVGIRRGATISPRIPWRTLARLLAPKCLVTKFVPTCVL